MVIYLFFQMALADYYRPIYGTDEKDENLNLLIEQDHGKKNIRFIK